MINVYKGVAHPWMCDVLGHLTTRFYVGMFDDAAYHFLHTLFGWTGASDTAGKRGFVDARHTIEYKNEVTAGELLSIDGCLTRIGNKSITADYQMINIANNEIVASMEVVYVLFDLETRKSLILTDDLRKEASRQLLHDEK